MNIGSLGIVGGMAATPLSQRTAETDRAERETIEQVRATQADDKAEQAGGIGQTEEDGEVTDRDADGRRPWELAEARREGPLSEAETAAAAIRAKDPRGEAGSQLDLLG
jgi:hypothetical protein